MDHQIRDNLCYHYTSAASFLKIMDDVDDTNIKFHASGIFSLNDPSELKFGYKEIMNLLLEIEAELLVEKEYQLSRLWDKDKSYTSEEWHTIHLNMMQNSFHYPFVISFSRNRESLPMWRMYGDNGKGIALGFDLRMYPLGDMDSEGNRTLDITHIKEGDIHSVDVEYGKASKFGYSYLAAKMHYYEYLKSVKGITDCNIIAKKQLDTISVIIMASAPYIKHDAYNDEKESRLVYYHSDNNIKFKTNAAGNITPYIDVKIPKSCLREIILGPCCDYDYMKSCVDLRMKQKGFNDNKITNSSIPYRP